MLGLAQRLKAATISQPRGSAHPAGAGRLAFAVREDITKELNMMTVLNVYCPGAAWQNHRYPLPRRPLAGYVLPGARGPMRWPITR
jgi:hypothetical protein